MRTPQQIAEEMFRSDISLGQEDKAVIVAAIERDREQRTAPKLIAGLALWNPGAEYAIEYRSLEFSGSLAEQFYIASSHAPEARDYANARQFIIAVPGDLNDEGIVKFLDARIESIKAGDDIWTTGLVLRQA